MSRNKKIVLISLLLVVFLAFVPLFALKGASAAVMTPEA